MMGIVYVRKDKEVKTTVKLAEDPSLEVVPIEFTEAPVCSGTTRALNLNDKEYQFRQSWLGGK